MKRRLPLVQPGPLSWLYAEWLGRVVDGLPIPPETEAICNDCVMCEPATDGVVADGFFDPRIKCCTYVPALANFLVGRILANDDRSASAGRASVEARLGRGVAVTPVGLGSPPTFSLLYNATAPRSFGRSLGLRCPHYVEDGGRCGIWEHRPAVCATWFCKHVRGGIGMRFWQTAHQLLSGVERALAHWCVLELDVGAEALTELFPPPVPASRAALADRHTLDDVPDPAAYRAAWGPWVGREAQFYQECDRLVRGLGWDDVLAIGGQDVRIAVLLVQAAHRRLVDEAVPKALEVGRLEMERMDRQSCRVRGHSGGDALELPKELIDVLGYFDGRPTHEALAAIEDAARLRVDPALVRRLVDFEILVPKGTRRKRA